ncbi:cardiolipin synthase [Fredinandcohnia quinoae]|uniref:Cardiolipin synthase n=1 Tax=Fredinandcohnia quinoae TaxID=2918902 RepID=A0AAW5DZV6_9BACI|nr:cardiolipin synthase [Fredinandcohnia sp. SECRCQ15]MCH1626191.1 cardiolipin synthase [Fredinandcohnia sp. SECRCQ15]
MKIFIGTIATILILFVLLGLDYTLGRKSHLKKVENPDYPFRLSDLALYTTGEELFTDFFEDVKQAKDHIHIQFYIFENDKFGDELVSLLSERAKQGIEVRLLLDWVGSHMVTKEMEKELKDSGVQLSYSNKPGFPYWFYKLNARNHRKITVIDGKTGYIGGFNVGKEYLGKDPKYGFWRDYHLKIVGEGVTDLQTQFVKDWSSATKEEIARNTRYSPPLNPGKIKLRLIPTNGAYLQEEFIDLIRSAEKEIIIGSPYFIPGDELMEELIAATRRNVKVRVLLPKKPDHPLVKEGAYPYFEKLMKEGVEFYMYFNGFYHAKVIVVDDKVSDIGTANFDKRSMFANYEFNCIIHDKEFIQHIREEVEKDFRQSNKLPMSTITDQTFFHRVKVKIATWISLFL